ncbi:methionyl-tRNA formyltransferase [Candidatus Acetothermia bacterium]|jgi:methionyl-tRNA formyltransferase|nr:methionyl-tRNA formyltransferase [Candidatus Acetothermia bacterium]MCI2435963.1 methionyl-tRNA formyltransferase [Candidatus Acetothermia bacterium]
MRVVFVGTAPLGVPALHALAERHEILAVFTQPDRPAGRGLKLTPPPIKTVACKLGLSIYQPEKINREVEFIKSLSPDVIVVVAFGQFLSKKLLAIPRYGCINLHASLLPHYRGAAPIQWAIINGETETGLTTFVLSKEMDAGDILLQEQVEISDSDTAGTLHEKLAHRGPEIVLQTLEGLEKGTLTPRPQDHSQATFAPKIEEALGQIDWSCPARKIFNLVRGLNPAPGAYTFFGGQRLKIYASRIVISDSIFASGRVIDPEGPIVRCGDDALELREVQLAGKRRMSGRDFVNGHKIKLGTELG